VSSVSCKAPGLALRSLGALLLWAPQHWSSGVGPPRPSSYRDAERGDPRTTADSTVDVPMHWGRGLLFELEAPRRRMLLQWAGDEAVLESALEVSLAAVLESELEVSLAAVLESELEVSLAAAVESHVVAALREVAGLLLRLLLASSSSNADAEAAVAPSGLAIFPTATAQAISDSSGPLLASLLCGLAAFPTTAAHATSDSSSPLLEMMPPPLSLPLL